MDTTFNLNVRGTLFTVQKAFPLFNDCGSIFMTGSVAALKGFPGYSVYAASKATLHPRPIATPMQDQVLTPEAKQMFESLIPRGTMGRFEARKIVTIDSGFPVHGIEVRDLNLMSRACSSLTAISSTTSFRSH